MLDIADFAHPKALRQAWDHVFTRDSEDGRIAKSVRRFGEDLETNLTELSEELVSGSYRPAPLTLVHIPKDDGDSRELHIPVARDRVAERATAVAVAPLIDAELCPRSFAYRSGLGVAAAVDAIVEARHRGLRWGARVDIDNCFPTVNRQRALRKLSALAIAEDALNLVDRLVRRPVRDRGRLIAKRRGLPQGGSLSPHLSNLYLNDVDMGMWSRGYFLARYSDDMLILTAKATRVDEALFALDRLVEQGNQKLGVDKTMSVSFEEGFTYLGEEFNLRYPEDAPNRRRLEPKRRSLIVGHQGAGVRISKGRLVVSREKSEVLSVPASQVGRVVLSGSVGLSAGARSWALANNVGVVLLSRRGSYLGSLSGETTTDAARRRAQYRFSDNETKCLSVAIPMLFGKVSNQRTMLLRHTPRSEKSTQQTAVNELDFTRSKLKSCATRSELLGVEGLGARRYWSALGELLPSEAGFTGRKRRPPPDLTNCALGYAYAILLGEAVTAIAIAGGDPGCGLLHLDADRRPSLALDLIEEFRPVIVDSVIVQLIRKGTLTTEHIRQDPDRVGGVLLTERGRKTLVAAIENRLLTVFRHIPSGERVTYRRAIRLQAHQIMRTIESDGQDPYQPVLWR